MCVKRKKSMCNNVEKRRSWEGQDSEKRDGVYYGIDTLYREGGYLLEYSK